MGRPKKYNTDEERITAMAKDHEKYRKKNIEKIKEKNRRIYQRNKKKYIENSTKWRKNNPDRAREIANIARLKYNKRRTVLKDIEKIGEEEWMKTATDDQIAIWVEYKLKQQNKSL